MREYINHKGVAFDEETSTKNYVKCLKLMVHKLNEMSMNDLENAHKIVAGFDDLKYLISEEKSFVIEDLLHRIYRLGGACYLEGERKDVKGGWSANRGLSNSFLHRIDDKAQNIIADCEKHLKEFEEKAKIEKEVEVRVRREIGNNIADAMDRAWGF